MRLIEINQTDKAKKKITKFALKNNLEYDFVYLLFSLCWNYDDELYDEGFWVQDLVKDKEYNERIDIICKILKLDNNPIDKNYVVETIYKQLMNLNKGILENNFLIGSQNENYPYVSKYASYHYLANATVDRLKTLDWKHGIFEGKNKGILDSETIIVNVFRKIFRGGSVDKDTLDFLYTDFAIELPYLDKKYNVFDWTNEYLRIIDQEKDTLTDLIKKLKQYCKGNKQFLQTILEALSYSGKIKVKGHGIENKFIPDYRNEKSKHDNSNDWTYPLRFWNGK